jgi:flagellar protein FlgJ
MDISSISTNYTVANADKSAEQSNSLQSSLKNISSEEQLKGVIKDFESYFVEQVIKQMKDTFTSDDDEDSTMSQYKDLYMDQAIETVADEMVDQIGESYTQTLYEQMKRNIGQ